jgi:hypothetical protein
MTLEENLSLLHQIDRLLNLMTLANYLERTNRIWKYVQCLALSPAALLPPPPSLAALGPIGPSKNDNICRATAILMTSALGPRGAG